MAALSITPANVNIGDANVRLDKVVGGEALTQGQSVRKDTTTNPAKYYRTDANVSAATATSAGIVLTPCTADGASFVLMSGEGVLMNLGATLVVGETYCVGNSPGQIVPIGDLTTGDFPFIIGQATTTSLIKTVFSGAGVAKP
jgi:hypothetical protein